VNIQTLSAAKLQAAIDAQDLVCRSMVDAMIAAGRGYETSLETRAAADRGFDPLAISYRNAMDRDSDLRAEADRRKRYHGSMKPIKAV
jgi:hypothetical protein